VPYTVSFTAPNGYTFTVPNATVDTADSDVTTPQGGTPAVTLTPNEFNSTIDAGLWRPMSLGNQVWEDINNDGVRSAGEPGVGGVSVTLQTLTTTLSTLTDANGHYTFTNLISGTYVVSITAPAGYRSSTDIGSSGAPNTNIDSDDNGVGAGSGTIASNPITLAPGTEPTADDVSEGLPGNTNTNWTVDFGIWRPASLGDFVWSDLNANGQQDGGEPGVNGVTVTLYHNGAPISTTTTNALGAYTFTNLISGTYSVTFGLPAGFAGFTTPNSGSDVTDSDAVPVTPVLAATGNYVLFPGDVQTTLDAGLIQPAGLGDRVWQDFNHDGVQGSGEPGVGGVTVTLRTPTTTLSTLTDASGLYTFTNLTPGVPYTVSFTAPNGYTFTVPNATVDTADSDVTTPQGGTPAVTLAPNEFNPTIDAGLWQPMRLGNQVWLDSNNNGIIDAGEVGLDNVSVSLYADTNGSGVLDGGDALIGASLTSGGGYYLFTDLISNTYFVTLLNSNFQPGAALFNYQNSSLTVGGNSDLNNTDHGNVASVLGQSQAVSSGPVTLVPGSEPLNDGAPINDVVPNSNSNYSIDFGFYKLEVGNQVWEDTNNNGVIDAGEPSLPGVPVALLSTGGTVLSTTATNAAGFYTFTNLISGTYVISVTPPTGMLSSVGQDAGDATDNNDNGAPSAGAPLGLFVVSQPFALTPGSEPIVNNATGTTQNPTIDFGLWRPAALGDFVWADVNANGQQDAGETGVANVPVTLTLNGTPISTTTTNAAGYYTFTNLISGTYSVTFGLPAGFGGFTTPNTGSDATDSDAVPVPTTPTLATTGNYVLLPGDQQTTVDAGLIQLAGLGDRVWEDLNHDGVQGVGEPGIGGVVVSLQTLTTTLATLTDASGYYTFSNLMPGVPYTVGFTAPTGYTFTVPTVGNASTDSNANPGTGSAPSVTLSPNEFNPTIDAGVWQAVGLGDFVWFDVNHDGVQGVGEPGVAGVTVTVQTPSGLLTTVTDASGFYSFTNLLPGVPYTVGFTIPTGYSFTLPMVGNGAGDSNVISDSGTTVPITLVPGEFNSTIDAGLWLPLPNLTLVKKAHMARGTVRPGELVTYTLVIRNDGPGIATSVVISDPLPSALEYVAGSAVPAAQVNGQVLVWTKPSLGVGEQYTMTLVARVLPSNQLTGTQIVNVGFVFAIGPDNQIVNLPRAQLQDDGQAGVPFETTAVVLTLFRSTWLDDGSAVHVVWETGSEINTFGFGLYRSTDGTRESAVRITPEWIPSKSVNNGGAGYSFDDATAVFGPTYTYWLQELETTGTLNEYGPVNTDGKQMGPYNTQRLFMPVLMH